MIAALFMACNSKSDLDTNKTMILTDTSAMYRSNIMTDTGSVIETSVPVNTNKNTAVANKRINTRTTSGNSHTHHNGSSSTANSTTNNNTSTNTVSRKKGWSHAAKDATIGGVGGAVLGAVISKDKVKGAVIVGVIGAGGGYILGRSKDKKEGRIQ